MQPITPEDYVTCFAGYFLQDCAVINVNCLSFIMRNFEDTALHDSLEEQMVRKKVVWQEITEHEGPHGGSSVISNSEELFTTSAQTEGTEMVYVNSHGCVLIYNADGLNKETTVPDSTGSSQKDFFALTAKTINDMTYVCGHRGLVACRTGKNSWQDISIPVASYPGPSISLVDMDGFAPDDIYAISIKAGVFHYNGKQWERLSFPSNISLESICCGKDGKVYVGGQAGTLFSGRGSTWDRVHEGNLILSYTDMIWHDNALWCTNDYGVWTFSDGCLERAPVPDAIYACSGHLSAKDGLLLLGGMNGAALNDGTRWQVLYYQPEML